MLDVDSGRVVTINPLDTESRTDALETRDVPFINIEKIGGDHEGKCIDNFVKDISPVHT